MLLALNVVPVLLIVTGVVGRLPIPGYETLWAEPGAYVYGRRFAAGSVTDVLEVGRGVAGLVFCLVVYLVVYKRAAAGTATDGETRALLVAIQPRELAVAEILTLVLFSLRAVGVAVVAGAVAFGAGAGAVSPIVLGIAAGTALIVTAVAVSYPAVLALRLGIRRLDSLGDAKTVLTGSAVVVMFAVLLEIRQSLPLLATLPVGWYADLALLSVPAGASLWRAAVTVAALPVAAVGGTAVAGRLGEIVWTSDDPAATTGGTSSSRSPPLVRPLTRRVPRPVAAAVRANWLRLRREPRVFLFGGLLVVITASAGLTIADREPNALPMVVAVYGATTVGVGATLNPLGNEGPALRGTLTTPGGSRLMLLGYGLSVAIPGAVLVGVGTFAAATGTTLGPGIRVAVAALGAVLGALSPFISLGIGTSFPKFDGFDPTSNRTMQTPRLEAVVVFMIVMLAVGLPAVVGLYGGDLVAFAEPGSEAVPLAGILMTASAAVVAGWVSYRRALATVSGYELAA